MLFHLAFAIWAIPGSDVGRITGGAVAFPALAPISWFGWVGVEIFFVLSGIVICLSAQGASALGFARSRIVRLYPAAWVCGTLTLVVLLLLGQGDLPARFARTMLLFPTGPWVAVIYWTLAHEMAFYGLIFLLLLIGRFRYLPHLLSGLGMASTAFLILLALNQSGSLDTTFRTLLMLGQRVPATFLLSFGCFFALGGLIFLCMRQRCTAWRLAMIALCVGGSLLRIAWRTGRMSETTGLPLDSAVPAAIFALAVMLMAASLAWHEPISHRFGRHAARLRAVGLATYPLYLLHAPVGAAIMLGLRHLGIGEAPALAAAIAAVVTLAFLVSLFIERPIQSGLRHALTRSAAAPG
jgi:peptidoglycan/LPS O-acetylase OafA/YrhL